MKKTGNRLLYISIVTALVLGMTACNGTGSTDKAKDSLNTATAAAKATDSATAARAKKKKKGQTSVAGIMEDSSKMGKDIHGVYNHVEKAPMFPGGQTALATYINKNLVYPQSAVDNGTSGTINVSFIVDEHGKVVNPQVIDGNKLGDGLADETLMAFNKMPLWSPGLVHGKKVKTRLELPVTFELADADQ
jgi:periplasmic protein TonB